MDRVLMVRVIRPCSVNQLAKKKQFFKLTMHHYFEADGEIVHQQLKLDGQSVLVHWHTQDTVICLRFGIEKQQAGTARVQFERQRGGTIYRQFVLTSKVPFTKLLCGRYLRADANPSVLVAGGEAAIFWEKVFSELVRNKLNSEARSFFRKFSFDCGTLQVETSVATAATVNTAFQPLLQQYMYTQVGDELPELTVEQHAFPLGEQAVCVIWNWKQGDESFVDYIVVATTATSPPHKRRKVEEAPFVFTAHVQHAVMSQGPSLHALHNTPESIVFWKQVGKQLLLGDKEKESIKATLERTFGAIVYMNCEEDKRLLCQRYPQLPEVVSEVVSLQQCLSNCRFCGLVLPWCAIGCDRCCGDVCTNCSPHHSFKTCYQCKNAMCKNCADVSDNSFCLCGKTMYCQTCMTEWDYEEAEATQELTDICWHCNDEAATSEPVSQKRSRDPLDA